MLRKTLVLVVSVLAALAAYGFCYEPNYDGLLQADRDSILLYAHRGFGNLAPDNSLLGAKLALEAGLDGVDVDAQQSQDKAVVIFHDVSLERFTTGEGRVDSYTLAELQTYDLGEKFVGETTYQDVYIATFEDFVREITPEALLMTELKIATTKDTGMERQVIDIIEQYDAFDSVLISTFNPVVLHRLKKLDDRVQTVFIFQDSGWDPKRVAETKEADRVGLPWYLQTEWTRRVIRKLTKPDALSINHQVDEATIDRLKEQGWPIFLWPLNDEATIRWGIEKQPYGIVTDEPILTRDTYATYKVE